MYKIKKSNTLKYFARELPISFSDYYFHFNRIDSFWYKRSHTPSMRIDLTQEEECLLSSYKYALRYDIRKGLEDKVDIEFENYLPEGIQIMQKVAESHPQLVKHPEWLLKKSAGKVYSTATHEKYGCVAAHLHIYDQEEKIALLMINASDFRSYEKKEDQVFVGRANKLLFHRDFLYFKELGMEKYDMGGYTDATKSFKKLFNGKIVDTYRYEPYILHYLRKLKN